MLLIETLKSKISDFLYSNTCFCLRLKCTLQDSSLDTSCLYYNNSMPIFAPSTPNLIFCLINIDPTLLEVHRQRRTFFTPGCFHNFERSKDVSIYIYMSYALLICTVRFKKNRFNLSFYKEYFPNLLETGQLPDILLFDLETSDFGYLLLFKFS